MNSPDLNWPNLNWPDRPLPGTVRTVLGDVDPTALGVTFCHEHLIIDSAVVAEELSHIHLPSADEAIAEVRECTEAGVGTMVDAMPEGGRDLEKLRKVSRQTGMRVVASTGLHTAKYYRDPFLVTAGLPERGPSVTSSEVDLASRFVGDIATGCGMIKAATGEEGINPRAQRVFAAVAAAHLATGVPVITHCEEGRGALHQIDLLSSLGVPLDRVVISHTDQEPDPGYHRALLRSGVNLEYDRTLRQAGGDQGTARLLASMIEAGYLHQLMLGTDGARRSLWRTLGGSPGLAYLATAYTGVLADHGVGPDERRVLFVENPARWLAAS